MMPKIHLAFSVVSSIVVLVAVVWGIVLVGSPSVARLQRFDQQRLSDLQTIHREVQLLCRDPVSSKELKRPLPQSLEELASSARSRKIRMTDPETGERYTFRVINETTYEICATFSMERDSDTDVFWNHPAGRHCFTVKVLDSPYPSAD